MTNLEAIVKIILMFLEKWWWVFTPLIALPFLEGNYKYWSRWCVFDREKKWGLYELVPPGEIEKPFKAMEDVFNRLWAIVDVPEWRDIWCDGEPPKQSKSFSFEITSVEGQIHFYIRTEKDTIKMVESILHAHYPDMEIYETSDYVENAPQDAPNENYEMYGEEYNLFKSNYVLPIKTYQSFESSSPENVFPEKRVDPFNSLMEAMCKLKKGEQFWAQIVCSPFVEDHYPWGKRGREEADKIAKRLGKSKSKSIISNIVDFVFFGKVEDISEEKSEVRSPEAELTPGEKEVLKAIENKVAKPGFKIWMRTTYIAERDSYFKPNAFMLVAYFSHFAAQNMNFLMFWNKTRPKVQYFFRKRRNYQRKRNIFRRYKKRYQPEYPNIESLKGVAMLNSEELATIFHFPVKADSLPPGVPRISIRKGDAPSGIPTDIPFEQ